MATFDLGRVTPLYKGGYSASASYELNDVVLYNGNLYWHVQATATVGILPTDTTVWKLAFADEGIREEIRGYADNAQTSADSALASKSAAATSASQASSSASQAAQSAQTAQTAETGATASAQSAAFSAQTAKEQADISSAKAAEAFDNATYANQRASYANESASIANEAKTAAITNARLSVTKAGEARNSATQAASSATSAQSSASAASASETAAAASATNAAASEAAAKRYAEDSAAYLGAYPTDTAEGEIASFSDGADAPVKSLVVGIEPVQEGNGEPSPDNVRPISGWTGMQLNANGTTIPISWESEAGTVYGGKLNVTNGVLTVDMTIADMGTLNWMYYPNQQRIVAQVNSGKPAGANVGLDGACSVYKVVNTGYSNMPDKSVLIGNNFISNAYAAMVVFDSAYTDAETFKTAVSGQMFVFPIKNPIVYQLTPTEVKSLLGQNNIWADTGDTTVEYRADTSAYIARKIAEAISALS